MTKEPNKFLPKKVRRERKELRQAVEQIEGPFNLVVAGSWRREKATVGDLDILVPPEYDFGLVVEEFITFFAYEPIRSGAMKSEGIATYQDSPLLINLWRIPQDRAWGGMLLFCTGPYDLNIMMRAKAKGHGWTLSQYGLFRQPADDEGLEGLESIQLDSGVLDEDCEADIFRLLDLPHLQPVERETWRDVLLAKPTKKTGVAVRSSNGVDSYHVVIIDGKATECECKGWTYRHKCRHLVEAEQIWKRTGGIADG